MKRTTFTLSLSDELAELVKREAQRQRSSVSEVIRRLLSQAFMGTEERPRQIPWAGIVNDPTLVHGERIDEELERE
jgi:hypothetical protein